MEVLIAIINLWENAAEPELYTGKSIIGVMLEIIWEIISKIISKSSLK